MAVICCATPSELYLEETRSTLAFAARAKLVTTNPIVNEVLDDRSMIRRLQKELVEARRKAGHREVLERRAAWADSLARATEGKLGKLHRVHAFLINSGILSFKRETHKKRRAKRRFSESSKLKPINTSELDNLPKQTPETLTPGRKRAKTDNLFVPVLDFPLLRDALSYKTSKINSLHSQHDAVCQELKGLQRENKSLEETILERDDEIIKLADKEAKISKFRGELKTLEETRKSQGEVIKQQDIEIRRLREKDADMGKVRSKLKTLQEANKTQKDTIRKNEEDLQRKKRDLKAAEGARDHMRKELESTKQKLQTISGENKRMKDRLNQTSRPSPVTGRKRDEEFKKLQGQLASVKEQFEKSKHKTVTTPTRRAQTPQRNEKRQENDLRLEILQKELETVKNENERLSQLLSEQKLDSKAPQDAEDEILPVQSVSSETVEDKEHQPQQLQDELEQNKTTTFEATKLKDEEISELKQELERAKDHISEIEKCRDEEIRRLQEELENAKSEVSEIAKQKDEEIQKLKDDLTTKTTASNQLEQESEDRFKKSADLLLIKDKEIERLESDLSSVRNEKDQILEIVDSMKLTTQRMEDEMNEQKEKLEECRCEQQQQCEEIEHMKILHLKAIEEKTEEIEILQETLDTAVREQGKMSVKHDHELVQANEERKEAMSENEDMKARLEAMQNQLEVVKEEKDEALVACDSVNTMLEDMVASLEKAETSNESLKEELVKMTVMNELEEKAKEDALDKLRRMTKERDLLTHVIDDLERDFKEKNESFQQTEKDDGNAPNVKVECLRSKLTASQDHGEPLDDSMIEVLINEKREVLKNEFNVSDYERLVLRDSMSALEKERKTLREELGDAKAILSSNNNREKALNTEVEEIQASCVSLSAALTESENSRSLLLTTCNDLSSASNESVAELNEGSLKRDEMLVRTVTTALDGTLKLQTVESTFRAQMVGQLGALTQVLYNRMEKNTVLRHTEHIMKVLLQGLRVRNAEEEVFMAIGSIVYRLEDEFAVRSYQMALENILLSLSKILTCSLSVFIDLLG